MWLIILLFRIFLILLAILLAAVGYLLLAPIRYWAGGEAGERLCFFVSLQDPLHLITAEADYGERGLQYRLKLLWGFLRRSSGDLQEDGQPEDEGASEGTEDVSEDSESFDGPGASPGQEAFVVPREEPEEAVPASAGTEEAERSEPPRDAVPSRHRENAISRESKDHTRRVEQTDPMTDSPDEELLEPREPDPRIRDPRPPRPPRDVEDGEAAKRPRPKGRLEKIGYILSDSRSKQAFAFLIREGLNLLFHYRMRELHVDCAFATGYPDLTGETVGAVSALAVVFEDHVRIQPDFESDAPFLRGQVDFAGRIRLIHSLLFGLKAVLNRDCRRLYHQVRHL